ncbi:MAG: hypothetical protein LC644_11605 [Pseudonocardia sp.]|nr:hypothetical protein [Pseudonocardia sp.]
MAIEKFLKPAVGDTSLSRLARRGSRPFEQLDAELHSGFLVRDRAGQFTASFDAVLADSGIRSAFIR